MSYLKTLATLETKGYRPGEVFRSFVRLSACALAPRTVEECKSPLGSVARRSVSVREGEYLDEMRRYREGCADVFAQAFHELIAEMEAQPFTDVLGPAYMERAAEIDKRFRGTFFTPSPICKLMAQLTALSGTLGKPLDVHEPAVGSGAMILALAETLVERGHSPLEMRVSAIDIDPTAIDMCLINLSLWGVPAEVIQANALTLGAPGHEPRAVHRTPFWPLARAWRGETKKDAKPLTLGPGSKQPGLFQ